ncbi:MAG TPA: hypothetical protein VGV57_10770 [Thermoleophilaceae bacterium]|nr:hypothetical protein [Thermoleophilaceae bacterium]
MDDRRAARSLALGRIALGAGLLAMPGLVGSGWLGSDAASDPRARVLLRALGARDLALGFGLKASLESDAPTRGWLEAGLVADGTDLAATLTAGEDLPLGGRVLVGTLAGGGVALGAWLLRSAEASPAGPGRDAASTAGDVLETA